jgi:hypothetical protein
MAQIGTLTTGAGIITIITGQAQCEQYLMLGDVDTTNPLQGIQIEVDGESKLNIQTASLVTTFMKYMMNVAGTVVGLMFTLCLGKIHKSTTLRLTNAGATTPAIFAFSLEDSPPLAVPFLAATKGINALSEDTFSAFTALAISPAANVDKVDILFSSGNRNTFSVLELDALFCKNNPTEANGRLESTTTMIDNRDGSIASVIVKATTALTVMNIKLPDADFQRLKASM